MLVGETEAEGVCVTLGETEAEGVCVTLGETEAEGVCVTLGVDVAAPPVHVCTLTSST